MGLDTTDMLVSWSLLHIAEDRSAVSLERTKCGRVGMRLRKPSEGKAIHGNGIPLLYRNSNRPTPRLPIAPPRVASFLLALVPVGVHALLLEVGHVFV